MSLVSVGKGLNLISHCFDEPEEKPYLAAVLAHSQACLAGTCVAQ
jgi:hypothetical protein